MKSSLVDPVCGMKIMKDRPEITANYEGRVYHFCAVGCRHAFEANPEAYLNKKRKGWWGRYLERVQKATGGKPFDCCH